MYAAIQGHKMAEYGVATLTSAALGQEKNQGRTTTPTA